MFKKINFISSCLILLSMGALCSFGNQAFASKGLSLATGYGAAKIVPLRLAYQQNLDKKWNEKGAWPIQGYWEATLYDMKSHQKTKDPKQLHAASLSCMFRFQRALQMSIGWPYIEVGVGLSWLSKKEISNRQLGLKTLFEDKFGIGFRFGDQKEFDLGYKAIHFSNAYLGPMNDGINLHIISFGYWFN